jgi:hypothetical protein
MGMLHVVRGRAASRARRRYRTAERAACRRSRRRSDVGSTPGSGRRTGARGQIVEELEQGGGDFLPGGRRLELSVLNGGDQRRGVVGIPPAVRRERQGSGRRRSTSAGTRRCPWQTTEHRAAALSVSFAQVTATTVSLGDATFRGDRYRTTRVHRVLPGIPWR